MRSESHFRDRLLGVRKVEVEQSCQNAVGGEFEYRAKTKVCPTEPGGAIERAIIALDHATQGIRSIGVVEREERRQRSGWRH
jgi:hypothetical protein